jgi:hypothetical protein
MYHPCGDIDPDDNPGLLKTAVILTIFLFLALWAASCKADIEADTYFLSSDELRGRASGSPGIKTAQDFIIARLKVLGIPVTTQKVGDCQNVIATVAGSQPETYIVVGAHLDHMGVKKWRGEEYIQNGADDNASGCASILELAERVNRTKTLRTVVFVWFTQEETGMNGSEDFVDANPAPVFMLNVDMIGHLKDGGADSKTKPNELASLFEKYPFAQRITQRGSNRGSDQRSFNGVCPTIFLNTGLKQNYHNSQDDADTLDYEGMGEITDYAFDIILQVSGRQHEYKLR